MTQSEISSSTRPASPADEASVFRNWLEEHSDDLAELRVLHVDADDRGRLEKASRNAARARMGHPRMA